MTKLSDINIGIIGATGAVGVEALKLLEKINHPKNKISLFASERSTGKLVEYNKDKIQILEANEDNLKKIDVGLISVSSEVSENLAPIIVNNGGIVIDDGSAFRMKEEVPLVVPEINEKDLDFHKGIISIPNCTTTPMVMAIDALNKICKVNKVIVSTYQAVSGTGKEAVNELKNQLSGDSKMNVYDYKIANNVFPHVDDFLEDGFTKEEHKMINESKKILHDPSLEIIPTCVRVPVKIGHSESLCISTDRDLSIEDINSSLSNYSGIKILDNSTDLPYPMPLYSEGKDEVFVGRIRRDFSIKSGLNLWIVSDNLRKGAATNTIQIAEKLIEMGIVNS